MPAFTCLCGSLRGVAYRDMSTVLNNGVSVMKKFLSKVALFLSPVVLLAEGEPANNWDFSALATEIAALQTQYKAFFVSSLIPAAAVIIACGVVLYVFNRAPRSVGLGKK